MQNWIVVMLLVGCAAEEDGTPVRASLQDGQVMLGAVTTETLVLEGGLGRLEIPLHDVGEVLPVEGSQLSDANNHVTVWLRDGSELRGQWADPALEMQIAVGGRSVSVDLPMDELTRFQFEDGGRMQTGVTYRVRTIHGDDFYVDPEHTRFRLDNELGRFEPYLSECVSIRPRGSWDGTWAVQLHTGTLLIGEVLDEAVVFRLGLGPEAVEVALDEIVSLEREVHYDHAPPTQAPEAAAPRSALRALPSSTGSGGWYDSSHQSDRKTR